MKRRKFIGQLSVLGAGLCCIGPMGLSSCSSTKQLTGQFDNNKILVSLLEIGNDKEMVVRNEALEGPIFVSFQDEWIALSMICTHRGCTVTPAGSALACPCHGAEFSKTGQVLSPPASTPLQQYKVEVSKKHLIISL